MLGTNFQRINPLCACRELERLAKANAARAETDRILAEQEAAIAARREAIQQREAHREAAKVTHRELGSGGGRVGLLRCSFRVPGGPGKVHLTWAGA